MHVLPWNGNAGPGSPAAARYGSASVHCVLQLPGTRTENQPQGPLQSMWRPEDSAAKEDLGGPHRQR